MGENLSSSAVQCNSSELANQIAVEIQDANTHSETAIMVKTRSYQEEAKRNPGNSTFVVFGKPDGF